ncbi:hypothetical protein [Thalassobaculum sp.]|uniref:DUF4870 family protein n=1 Tax=Thalassobaculum sp. TaxID=2022740 RepID=UPI0032ED0548
MSDHTPSTRRNLPFRLSVPENDKLAIHVVYALFALSVVFQIPGMLGVILAYLKRGEVAGSYLETHVTWQIRTFWLWLLMVVAGWLTVILLVGWLILLAAHLWLIWRIVKGWLVLVDERPIDRPEAFF